MSIFNQMSEYFNHLNDLIVHASSAWWAMPATGFFIMADAFFPVVPSESLMVSFASLSTQPVVGDHINLWLLFLIGGAFAAIGDNISYWIGRLIGTERFKFTREGKGRRAIEFARKHLEQRATILILTARYIPFGRTAVTMTAGATRFAWKRYAPLSLLAGFSWAAYSIAIGTLAASWVHGKPLVGIVIAIAAAGAIGFAVDKFVTWLQVRRDASTRQQ